MNSITLHSPLDMHVHLRQDAMLHAIAPLTARYFAGAVVMPNLLPPIDSTNKLQQYTSEIRQATRGYDFEPYMTLFFKDYSEQELLEAKDNIIGIKLYPAGATTNSDNGVREIGAMHPTFSCMEELGIPLLVHGETHGFVLDREQEFTAVYDHLARTYPKLIIVMEHITTAKAVEMLDKYDNLFATITVHHLMITLDDVVGGLMRPHLFCKPIAKRPEDREALLRVSLDAHPKVMFGSDSAPHPVSSKECPGCAAGIFTAPIALQLLASIFDSHSSLHNLQAFVSDNARSIYGIHPPQTTVSLSKTSSLVPDTYNGVIPMLAGEMLAWSVVP